MENVKILKRLQEHLDYALKVYPHNDWFVIALQGSQNYNLADEQSDIDSKLILFPNLDDLIIEKKQRSHTLVLPNEEHIDVKDIRAYFDTFFKQNINFVEILFTKYYIVNENYQNEWNLLRKNAERLARVNEYSAIKCMVGMCHQKLKDFTNGTITTKHNVLKYGYDSKQLLHILRIKKFLEDYINDVPYKDAIVCKNREYLLDIKRYKANLSYDEAYQLASSALDDMDTLLSQYENTHQEYDIDKNAIIGVNTMIKRLIKFNILKEVNQ